VTRRFGRGLAFLGVLALLALWCVASQPVGTPALASGYGGHGGYPHPSHHHRRHHGIWQPAVGTTWQWQLDGTLDLSVAAQMYDVDGFDTAAAQVTALHQAGRHAVCYLNAGAYESWRPDAWRYPSVVLGRSNGWSGERWVDIRRWDILEPILADRIAMCVDKGFDGVEPDNVDGYENGTGFPLSASDQITFNERVAALVHAFGLSVALKNDVDQAGTLQPYVDYAIDEQCVEYDECGALVGFIRAGKPVFHVEYDLTVTQFCPVTRPLGFSSMRKHYDLDAWRQPC
jgi:hypothetical protein